MSKANLREGHQSDVLTIIKIRKSLQLTGSIARLYCIVLTPICGIQSLWLYVKRNHKKRSERNQTRRVVEEEDFCSLSDGGIKLNPQVLLSVNIG